MAQTSDRGKPPPSDPALEDRVTALERQVASLESNVSALMGMVNQQAADIVTLEQSVVDLDNRLAVLETGTPEQPPDPTKANPNP